MTNKIGIRANHAMKYQKWFTLFYHTFPYAPYVAKMREGVNE